MTGICVPPEGAVPAQRDEDASVPWFGAATPIENALVPDEPTVVCIAGSQQQRLDLFLLLSGYGQLVFAPDQRSAAALLGASAGLTAEKQLGDLRLLPDRRRVTWQDAVVQLTPIEFELLDRLTDDPGVVWPYDKLHQMVWHNESLGDRGVLHSAIKRLRRKLRAAGVTADIESVRGVGFRFQVDDDRAQPPALSVVERVAR